MSALIRVVLSNSSARLQPGEKVEATITVHNFSEVVDRYQILVEGVEPAWATLSRSELSLFPKDQDQVLLTLSPPAGTQTRAGHYDVLVHVVSQENTAERTTVAFNLEVGAQTVLDAALRPQKQSGQKEGIFSLQLSNQGNTDLTVALMATDPEEGCTYTFDRPQVAVPAGQERLVQLRVRPKSPPPGKQPKLYAFAVTAKPAEVPKLARQVQGEWEHLPRSKRAIWPILLAALLGLAALAAAVIFLLIPFLQGLGDRDLPPLPVTLRVPTEVKPTVLEPTKVKPTIPEPTLDTSGTDADGDGLSLADEESYGTDPNNPDSDGDGLNDGVEVNLGTSPLGPDSDGDWVYDGLELETGTDPLAPDSDGDGLHDGVEMSQGTNPLNPDTDGDGLSDEAEVQLGTDPLNSDSDGDGVADGADPDPLSSTLPDLVVTDIHIEEGNKIQCGFANTGDGTVPEVTVRIAIYAGSTQVSNSTVGTPIPPGNSGWLRTGPLDLPPKVSVYCLIDSENAVAESNEGNNDAGVVRYPELGVLRFDRYPDGRAISESVLVGSSDFLDWGVGYFAAPEGSYCSDAQAAIRVDGSGTYLSAARPGQMDACGGVPVSIYFHEQPVRSVRLVFMGADVDYVLTAYSWTGSAWQVVGQTTMRGQLNSMTEIALGSRGANISRIDFGYQTALTRIYQVTIER